MTKIIKHYRDVKKAIRKSILPDSYFVSKYSFSPYMACEHACKYCDGRAEKYHVEGDYEKDIVVRENIPHILASELPKLREPGTIIIGSGISDSYQPVESEEMLMRKSAKILLEHNFPVCVMTKSSLVERDLDIWKQLNKKNGFTLVMSLTFTDDKHRKIFEPGASTVEERLATLELFKNENISTGVLAMPFLPHISDNEENIHNLMEKLKEIKVDYVLPGLLTLRPGKQKDIFMNEIKQHYPELFSEYEQLYSNELRSGIPVYDYRREKFILAEKIIAESGLNEEVPHYIYHNKFAIYDEIFILLSHMIKLYSRRNISIKRLKSAYHKFAGWLKEEKKYFNRRRSINYNDIENKIYYLFENNGFEKLIGNKKLTDFLRKVVLEHKEFDYQKLKIK
ncbi:MAG: radical SAM protein [Candidatus Cloacimonetes bacterium]|nr:radical SAM protein [Candidatus Cloacimonadota bacterium]